MYYKGEKNIDGKAKDMRLMDILFRVDDTRLQTFYHRAWLETDRGYVDPRKFPYLDRSIIIYARNTIAHMMML